MSVTGSAPSLVASASGWMAWLDQPLLGHPAGLWLAFLALTAVLLVLDLGVLHRRPRSIGLSESLLLTAGYVGVALLFCAWIGQRMGTSSALAFLTGYLVEKSLSIDNVFVIALLFASLGIPRHHQHRVLLWGVLGAMLMRGVLIGLGAALVNRFEWVLYLFGGLLLVTGVRMCRDTGEAADPANHPLLVRLRRHLRVWPSVEGNAFLVRRVDPASGRRQLWATPLLLALVLVEISDLVFAVDSVPAIFSITTDPFIVYTSNILAILGLRALYFALAELVHRFHYLRQALAAVLVFIAARIFLHGVGIQLPEAASLAVTLALLSGGVAVSLWRPRPAASAPGSVRPGT